MWRISQVEDIARGDQIVGLAEIACDFSGACCTGGWKASLAELDVSWCGSVKHLANYGFLYHCKNLRVLGIEGNALKTEGLEKFLGNSREGEKWKCKGFPTGLQELRCAGNTVSIPGGFSSAPRNVKMSIKSVLFSIV